MNAEPTTDNPSWRHLWNMPHDVSYLNHGSFGPSPVAVQKKYEYWTRKLEQQPMNFFLREMEKALEKSLAVLAEFTGASRSNLVFVDNATFGMNVVAASVRLKADDEVLVNDHEYGAVSRIWRRTCQQDGARLVTSELQDSFDQPERLVEELMSHVTKRTRLIVVSHVTSPTAMVLPVEEICRRARELDIAVCIDGPHAVAMLPLNLKKLDCDFYTASCHKWLSAPFGSGFLYVAPRQQKRIQPAIVSWGGSIGGRQPGWKDEFNWLGTRNPAAFLATADAIGFLQQNLTALTLDRPGKSRSDHDRTLLEEFRSTARCLTDHAAAELARTIDTEPLVRHQELRCPAMTSLVLPAGKFPAASGEKSGQRHPLQDWLWEKHRIEVPVIRWKDQLLLRVSAHLYNSPAEYSHLAEAVAEFIHRQPLGR